MTKYSNKIEGKEGISIALDLYSNAKCTMGLTENNEVKVFILSVCASKVNKRLCQQHRIKS